MTVLSMNSAQRQGVYHDPRSAIARAAQASLDKDLRSFFEKPLVHIRPAFSWIGRVFARRQPEALTRSEMAEVIMPSKYCNNEQNRIWRENRMRDIWPDSKM